MENSSWVLMLGMALILGVKHGFDLDHLATIDAITRTLANNSRLSKMVGFLFSLGHGLVVSIISLIIGSGLVEAHTPEWLDAFGKWTSVFFLFAFGFLTLWNIFRNPAKPEVPTGIKNFLTKTLAHKGSSPGWIMLIGALFAFSFDTFSQVALFSISASLVSGWLFAGILGIAFTLGMMLADGLNGLVIAQLIQRAGLASLLVSRGLGLAIALFSLSIGFTSLLELI